MNSRNNNIRFYSLSLQTIILLISTSFGQSEMMGSIPPHYAPNAPAVIPPPMIHLSPPPPPPSPPPSNKKPEYAVWCVAKPTVPEVFLQQAMDYACGSGAGCEAIQRNGDCFQPDTILSHASYAFNSYWQKTKQAGGTCEFGGTAMLITVDPSYNDCRFLYI